MRIVKYIVLVLLLIPALVRAQQIRTNFPPPYTLTASPALILSVGQFDEYNVLLTASGTITFSVPVISNATILFRVNTCQNGTGGFTPTFTALGSTTIVNRAPTVTTLTPNACDTENWSYRQETNQLILESVSLKTGSGMVLSGTGPQIGQYPAGTGTIIGPATVSGDATIAQGGAVTVTGSNTFTGHGTTPTITNFSVNSVLNVQAYGAVPDSSTNNTAAIQAAITALPATGGKIFFPSAAGTYNFATKITIPRNVTLECANTDSGILNYTGTGGALIWADAAGGGIYRTGGMTNCTLQTSTGVVGVFTGGDPGTSCGGFACAPSGDYGDNVVFYNDKIAGFTNGWEQGNNSWLVDWYAPKFVSNTTGIQILNSAVQIGENNAVFGGSIINGTNGIQCMNPNTDLYMQSVSIDGMLGTPIIDGDGTHQGCGMHFDDSHIEQFDGQLHPFAHPIIQIAGPTAFSNFTMNGGVVQFDDVTTPTIESIMKVIGGANHGQYGKLANIRVSSNNPITFSATCAYANSNMCIESDGATWYLDNYSFYYNGETTNSNVATLAGTNVHGELSAENFGARGDAIYSSDGLRLNDGVTNGTTTFASATGHFLDPSLNLIGDQVYIEGAGTAGAVFVGSVVSVQSSTSLTLSGIPPTNVTGAIYVIGFDNTTALNNFAAAMRNSPNLPSSISGYIPVGSYLEHGVDFAGAPGIKLRGAGAGLMGAGSGVNQGGTLLLCLKPTPTMGNSGKLCHDFTGDISSTISDLTLANGIDDVTSGGSGSVNALFARSPGGANFFGIVNQIQNVVFRSYGGPNAYGMVNYGYEQTDYLDDVFNWDADTAKAIYLSNINTPGFTSPGLGTLGTPPTSTTAMTFMGGKWQVSSNGCPSTPSNRSVLCCGPSGVGSPLNPASSCSVEGQTSGEQEQAAVTFDGDINGINFFGGFFRLNGPDDVLFKDTATQVQTDISITGMDGEEGTSWTSGSTLTANNRMVDFQGDMNAWSVINDLMSFNTNVARASTATDWKARQIVGSNFQTYNTTSFANPEWQCTGSPPNATDTYFGNASNALISCSVDGGVEHNFSGLVGAATFFGRGTPGISGGGALTAHANSTTGEITNIAASGNVLTPGYSCASVGGNVVGGLIDVTMGTPVHIAARSATTITFSGTSTDTVDYFGMGCG